MIQQDKNIINYIQVPALSSGFGKSELGVCNLNSSLHYCSTSVKNKLDEKRSVFCPPATSIILVAQCKCSFHSVRTAQRQRGTNTSLTTGPNITCYYVTSQFLLSGCIQCWLSCLGLWNVCVKCV